MNPFGQLGELKKMRDQAMQIQKQLQSEELHVEKKGVEYLLQAMPKILSKLPSSRLIIVGEGSLKNNLEEIVKNKKLENAVTFIGPVNNKELPKYYASSDIFIGPSIMTDDGDTEGLGLTFIEASMSECVPVGSRVGGITDVIQENKTGLLVEEKNPDDIADKIISRIR